MGFLMNGAGDGGNLPIDSKQNSEKIVEKLVKLVQLTEPKRFTSAEDVTSVLSVSQVVDRHIKHHTDITEIFRKMYSDVAFKISPSQMDLSIFRSRPYFQQLESTMEELVQWGAPEKSRKDRKAAEKKESGGSGGEKKMGFGK